MQPNYNKIKPVRIGVKRPLWSVIIPTFNCAIYLRETLESVLNQYLGLEQMEIIVVDDHSTKDDPEKVVNDFGQGKVKFLRQQANVGKSKNYETGINASKGLYIHLLHGDDLVNKGFYSKMEVLFSQFPEAGAAFCQCSYIDNIGNVQQQTGKEIEHEGILQDWTEKIATWQRIQPPSIVFKREVYETIGGYDVRLSFLEDWEFYVRASLHFKYAYTPEILANYRVFPESSSQRSVLKGKRIKALKFVIQIIDGYLSENLKKQIKTERNISYINYLLQFIAIHVRNRDLIGWLKTMKQIIFKSSSIRLILRGIKLTYRTILSK